MSADDRVSVKTTVPEYQKQGWVDHAEALDMSQSEFVRTMVQSGRREFEIEPTEPRFPDSNPRGNGLEEPVLDALSVDDYREFDEIVDSVADHLEELVEEVIDSLSESGTVEVSSRRGVRLGEASDGGD